MIALNKVQRGFSLIELMVAMVIALLVMAGVVNSFVASREANRINDELAFIQENARFALDSLSRDIRQAGDFGCTATAFGSIGNSLYPDNLVSVVNINTNDNNVLYKRVGIEGFDHSAAASFPNLVTGSAGYTAGVGDALVVRRGDADQRLIVRSHSNATAIFQLAGTGATAQKQSFRPGTFMVATDADCRHQAVFELTGPATANNTTVEYGGNVALTPNNCVHTLNGRRRNGNTYYMGDCSDSASWVDNSDKHGLAVQDFQPGASLMPLKGSIYFIAQSSQDPATNSLWMRSLAGAGAVPAAEELADGVVDVRISYAVNINPNLTDPLNPSSPTTPAIVYATANSITADEPNAAAPSYMVWNRVVAVRIQILMRSRTQILPTAETHDFSGNFGAGYAAFSDRYLYQLVSTTVAVRNAFKG